LSYAFIRPLVYARIAAGGAEEISIILRKIGKLVTST